MSYLVLARKYRPQSFAELVGQEFVSTALRNSIKNNRISHAYLFSGPRGVGKTSVARILAKAMNCNNVLDGDPCNKCESCLEISSSLSFDVTEIDGASNRGVEEIRQLKENIKFMPVNYKYKVYIIDEVHMLTGEAFNALLKTLEEPPVYVKFILATTDIHKIPDTILSRCQQYNFSRISFQDMTMALKDIYGKEGITADSDTINLVIRRSEGCMRDALSFSDQLISYAGTNITYNNISNLIGEFGKDIIDNIFTDILSEKTDTIDAHTDQIIDSGISLLYVVEKLILHTRNLLLLKSGSKSIQEQFTTIEIEYYRNINTLVNNHKLFAIFQIFNSLYTEIKESSFERYSFEFGLYKASSISQIIPFSSGINVEKGNNINLSSKNQNHTSNTSINDSKSLSADTLKYKVENIKSTVSSKESINHIDIKKKTKSRDSDSNINVNLTLRDKDEEHHTLIDEIKKDHSLIASHILYSSMELKGDKCIFTFPKSNSFGFNIVSQDENKKSLELFLSNKYKKKITLELILSDDGETNLAIKKNQLESIYDKKIKDSFYKDPVIKDFLNYLGVDELSLKVIKNS